MPDVWTFFMTAEQLKQIHERVEAATHGPWTAELDQFSVEEGIVASITDPDITMLVKIDTGLRIEGPNDGSWTAADSNRRDAQWRLARTQQEIKDATFIAAARTDVPALLAEVARLRHELNQVYDESSWKSW